MKFWVLVTTGTTMSAQVCVEADSPADAEQKATRLEAWQYQWEHDDGNEARPYIASPGDSTELITG